MKSSPRRGAGGFDVFDFKEEDELADLASEKFLEKFKNSSVDHHSTLKDDYLECGNAFLYFPTVYREPNRLFFFALFGNFLRIRKIVVLYVIICIYLNKLALNL